MNSRKLDFGVRDDGARIDHVILPPWAQGMPSLRNSSSESYKLGQFSSESAAVSVKFVSIFGVLKKPIKSFVRVQKYVEPNSDVT